MQFPSGGQTPTLNSRHKNASRRREFLRRVHFETLESRDLMAVTLTLNQSHISENGGSATFTLTNNGQNTTQYYLSGQFNSQNNAELPAWYDVQTYAPIHEGTDYGSTFASSGIQINTIVDLSPGESHSFDVSGIDNSQSEPNKIVRPVLCWWTPVFGGEAGEAAAQVTIVDDDGPSPIVNITKNVSKKEGQTLDFTVSLLGNVSSVSSENPVTVQYKTESGSAQSPADFVAKSPTTLTFTSSGYQTVSVQSNTDVAAEQSEDFTVPLSNATNAVLGSDSVGIGTIIDVAPPAVVIPVMGNDVGKPCCGCPTCSDQGAQNLNTGANTRNTPGGVLVRNRRQDSAIAFPFTPPSDFAGATSLTMQTEVNGVTGSPITFNPSNLSTSAEYRINFLPDPAALGPSQTPYRLTFNAETPTGTKQITLEGETHAPRPTPGLGKGMTIFKRDMISENANNVSIESCCGDTQSFRRTPSGTLTPTSGDNLKRTMSIAPNGNYEVQDKNGKKQTFDPRGMLLTEEDRSGNFVHYTYIDANNDGIASEISQEISSNGETKTYSYNSQGLVSLITDPDGLTHQYGYTDGFLTSVIESDPDGSGPLLSPTISLTWNSYGDLESYTNTEGTTESYTYDSAGRLSAVYENGVLKQTVNAAGSQAFIDQAAGVGTNANPAPLVTSTRAGTSTDSLGHTESFKADRFLRPTQQTDALGNTTDIGRDDDGMITSQLYPDPDGSGPLPRPEIIFVYDANKNLTEHHYPDGSVELWTYHPVFNVPTSHTDQRGFVTVYQLDPNNGNVLEQREVIGLADSPSNGETNDVVTMFSYTAGGSGQPPAGLPVTITDALGRVTAYDYNQRGNVTRVRTAVGTSIEAEQNFVYNSRGLLIESRDELDRTTIYSYDGLNRLKTITLPDPDGLGPLTSPVVGYEYDALNRPKKQIDPLGRVTEFVYDARGRKIQELAPDHDNDGNLTVTSYTYNNADQLNTSTDPLGRVTTYFYDAAGRNDRIALPGPNGTYDPVLSPIQQTIFKPTGEVSQQIDPLGNITKLLSNFVTRTSTVEQADPDGTGPLTSPTSTTITDATGNVVTSIDPLGRTTTSTFDRWGRPLTVTQPDPDGTGPLAAPVTTYAYDKVGNLRFITDPLGNVTEYQYDAHNRRIAALQPDPDGSGPLTKPTTLFIYDDASQQTAMIDPLGRMVSYTFDNLGRQIAVAAADPDGSGPLPAPVTHYAYDAANRTTSVTDPNGNITTYGYDLLGHRTSVTLPDPDGAGPSAAPVSTFVFDAAGQLLSQTDALGRTTTFHYDSLGRRDSITQPDPDGSGPLTAPVTTYAFDAAGNLLTTTDATGSVTTNVYDNLLRTKSVIGADPDGSGPLTAPVTTYNYDAAGQLLSTVDAFGRVTTFGYDALGRRTTVTQPDPDGNGPQSAPVTTYTYDAVGNLLTTTDPLGKITTNVYDGLNRTSTQTNQLGYTWQFRYDSTGNLLQKTDRRGRVISYEYDHLDRRTDERWFESIGNTTVIGSLHYDYDLASQLLSVATTDIRDGQTLTRANYYTYDNLGRTISETQNPGLGAPAQFDSTYDAVGNRLSIQAGLFDGATLQADYRNEYAYDALHRLTQLTQQGVSGGNAVAAKRFDFAYNTAGQFTSLTRYASLTTSDVVATTNYGYDSIGRLTDLHHQQGTTSLARYQYVYDAHSRITSIDSLLDGVSTYNYDNTDQLTGADHTASQPDEAYSYDENGNRTMANHIVGLNNQLLTDGTFVYQYDSEGNRSLRQVIATGARTEYVWDNRNRLTRVIERAPGQGVDSSSSSFWYGSASGDGYQVFASNYGESGPGYITFSLSEAAAQPVTISYWTEIELAVPGVDYSLPAGSVTIPAGEYSAYLYFSITDDSILEGTESFAFRFQKTGESAKRLSISIYDNDVGSGSASGSGSGTFYGSASGNLTVAVSASTSGSSSSYGYVNDYGYFAASASGSNYSSGYAYGSASFRAPVSSNGNWSYGSASGDGINAYASNGGEQETLGNWGFWLNQTETNPVTIEYWIESETATEGTDFYFSGGTVTIDAGSYGAYGSYSVVNDVLEEGTESFRVHFRRSGTTDDFSFSVNIIDNDPSTSLQPSYFSANASSSVEGSDISLSVYAGNYYYNAELTVTLIPVTPTVANNLPTNNYVFSVPYGGSYTSFNISTFDDLEAELNGQFILRLQFTGPDSVSDPFDIYLTLADNDTLVLEQASFSAYATAGIEGDAVGFNVYVPYRPYEAQVNVQLVSNTATAGVDFPATVYTFTIPAYSSFASFSLPTWDDTLAEGTESFGVRFTFVGSYSQSNTFEIPLQLFDNEPVISMANATLSAYASSGMEGSPVYISASLWVDSYQYLSESVTVSVQLMPVSASYGSDIPSQSYSLTFGAGNYSGYDYLSIPTFDDNVYEGNEQFIVRLQVTGQYGSGTWDILLELADNDALPVWTTQVDYYYDDQNRLIARQEQYSTLPALDRTTAFYHDGNQVVLKAENGLVVDRLAWGPFVDQLLADERIDWTDLESPESKVLWPLGDHLNSNRDLTVYDSLTQTTVVANHIIYDSFGNLITQSNSTFVTDWRWTGRWFDITTGLQNNLNRWYDPKIGQWVSEDPIGFDAGDANIRRNVENRVLEFTDPLGLLPFDFQNPDIEPLPGVPFYTPGLWDPSFPFQDPGPPPVLNDPRWPGYIPPGIPIAPPSIPSIPSDPFDAEVPGFSIPFPLEPPDNKFNNPFEFRLPGGGKIGISPDIKSPDIDIDDILKLDAYKILKECEAIGRGWIKNPGGQFEFDSGDFDYGEFLRRLRDKGLWPR